MDTLEFENNGRVVLRQISSDEISIVLLFDVTTGVDDAPNQQWQITCVDVRAHRLAAQEYCDVNICDDHVLLWPHLVSQTAVSFYSDINDPFPIIGALYQRHIDLVGTWIPFECYFNQSLSIAALLCGTAGMLAEGPEPLVLAYEVVLQEYGVHTGHRMPQVPKRWNVETRTYQEERGPLSVLLLDDMFVVAAAFEVSRLD
jgi:hypothetical protein